MILTKCLVKNINIDLEINDKISSGRLEELLIIVPTNRKIRSLKKEFISSAPGQSTSRLNIDTLGTLSEKLLIEHRGGTLNILTEASSAVLLRQCFQETHLSYFSYYKKEIPAGTLSRIKNVIAEYKKHGISPARLNEESNTLSGSEKIKAADIAALYEKYLDKCRQLNLYETGDIYTDLTKADAESFNYSFREIYPKVDLVIVMGFDEFTSLEVDIINSVSEVPELRLFLSFDYYLYNPEVFSHLDKCYDMLKRKGFITAEDITPGDKAKFHSIIRKGIFHNKKTVQSSSFIYDLTKITALTREKEVELLAKEVKELIAGGADPANICIAFNLITKYSPIIRHIFLVYGIPFNLTDRYPLNTSQPVISIINFLEIVENDFFYKNIFRALNSGFIKVKDINVSNLLKVSARLKIISGYLNWMEQIQDAIKQNDIPKEKERNQHLSKELYQRALEDIGKIHKILVPFTKKMTLGEFRQNLNDIIFSLDIPSVIINSIGNETEENIKAVTTFIETVNELLELLELEYGKTAKFHLRFYLNNIRTAVISSRFNIKEKPGYGVQVTTLNEIRGLKFDYLFLGGLTDGDFPTRFAPEIFFSGSFARGEYNHSVEERYLFYQALCSWNKGLYFSIPQQEETREFSESTYIAEFSKLFSIQSKSEKDYTSRIYSKEEMLIELGKFGISKITCYPQIVNEINPVKLERVFYISEIRARAEVLSEYTGTIADALGTELQTKLSDYKQRQFSISQLETYAKCPFKFFVERILGVEVPDEPTEEIEAIEMGSLLHAILYEFYSIIRQKKIILSQATGEQFAYAENLIFSIAQQKLEEGGFRSNLAFYEKEKLLGINRNRKNSLLYKFLLAEKDQNDEFVPEFFEKAFGNIDSENTVNIQAGEIFVRGKIDRIDINEKEKTYRVVDYKLSGKKPSQNDIESGISLQLPLYMYAAAELIKRETDESYTPDSAAIYSLKFSEKEFGRKDLSFKKKKGLNSKTEETSEMDVISNCIKAINQYVAGISAGKFNLSALPNKDKVVCGWCEFKGICRVKETE